MELRVQKFLSSQGVSSRRQAEILIKQGLIKVNGEKIKLGTKINPHKDQVTLRGKIIKAKQNKPKFVLFYKPIGYTCTSRDFKGEKNIYQIIKNKKLIPVGRLDKDSEGLLLLTNNGDMAHLLMHPKFKVEKEYEITVTSPLKENDLLKMCRGIREKGVEYRLAKFKIKKPKVCTVVLREGKKREIRKLFAHQKYSIRCLKRIRIKNLRLGKLTPGQWRELRESEIDKLFKNN